MHDPADALELDAAAVQLTSDIDPDLYEPEPGDPSYVAPGVETPTEETR